MNPRLGGGFCLPLLYQPAHPVPWRHQPRYCLNHYAVAISAGCGAPTRRKRRPQFGPSLAIDPDMTFPLTHRFSLDDAKTAFELSRRREDDLVRAVFFH